MRDKTNDSNNESSQNEHFLIGGKDLFAPRGEENTQNKDRIMREIKTRVGELLKVENMSILLGAGASSDCGGPMLSQIPIAIEKYLYEKGTPNGEKIEKWLRLFYLAANVASEKKFHSNLDKFITRRVKQICEGEEIDFLVVNYEKLLSTLYVWSLAMSSGAKTLNIQDGFNFNKSDLDICLEETINALVTECSLPKVGCYDDLTTHKLFMRKLLSRPTDLKRVNIFTLNYDELIEKAADAEGITLFDGFVGVNTRRFRPDSYEQDMHFSFDLEDSRSRRYDRVLRLYKLHGSISWRAVESSLDNPYGVESTGVEITKGANTVLLYPATGKLSESLGMPYAELFRRFSSAVVRPQSVLIVIGYGFADEHVNMIIRQALAVPSFNLVVIDPSPESQFVETIKTLNDTRIWIAHGTLGKFSQFTERLLPDLIEDEIRQKVMNTQKAVNEAAPNKGENQ